MTTTLQQVNATPRVFMGTLTDNADLHEALAEVAQAINTSAATFEMLGGLTEAEFTEYDFVNQTRKPALVFKRALEILAGHGTISLLEGEVLVHTHLLCAFRDEAQPHGIAVIGGHMARARAFAVEFTLTAYNGAPVTRAMHAGTGLKLWHLPTLERTSQA